MARETRSLTIQRFSPAVGIDGVKMKEIVVESSAKAVIDLNEKIRVLHVDDDPGILKITKQCLESEAPVEVDTALSVEEALKKLEKEKFDIVVSDYQMPLRDGLDFLKTLRSNGNTIPFIMFTGKGREEVAIKALNLGANQYLNKVGETETVYTELAHNIIELARTRNAEQKQCESEEKFRNLFEKANDGLVFVDLAGRIVEINQKAAEIAGKRKEDIVGKSFLDLGLINSKNLPVLAEKLRQAAESTAKPAEKFEFEIQKDNGEKRIIEINSTLIQKNNVPTGSITIVRDVTERKKAEEALRESEERYSRLAAAAFEGIGISEQGKIMDVNDQLAKMLGFEPGELIGKAVLDIVAPESRDLVRINMQKGYEGPYEHQAIRKDGSVFPVEIRARLIHHNGHTARVSAIRDITEGKKLEKSLRENEEKLRAMFSASPHAISVFDLAGKVIDVNEAAMKLHGFSRKEDILGKSSLDYVAPKDRSRARELYDTMIKRGGAKAAQFTLLTVDGRELDAEVSGSVVKDSNGVPICVVVALKDVTEQRRAEERIRQSEQKYKELFENAYDAILVIGLNGTVNEANNAVVREGYRKEDLVGKNILDFVPEKYHSVIMKDFSQAAQGKLVENEIEIKTPNGKLVAEYFASAVMKEENVVGVQVIIRGLNERKQFEKTLLENQQRFRGLFMGNPEAAAYLGTDYHILDINPRFEELFGYTLDEIKGKHINDAVVPKNRISEAESLDQKALGGYVYHNTQRQRKDGALVPVAVSAAPITVEGKVTGIVAMYKDISELKMAENAMKEMMQKLVWTNEKLQVVGGLTRHDVRNKLSAISGNVYLLKKQHAGESGVLEKLVDMETAVQQVTEIFEFAKAYESLGVEELVYVDVGETVNEATAMFPNLKDVRITNNCEGLTVLADSLLRQMFYNLIDNSLKHGQTTSRIEIHYQETGGDELKLYYEDDGVGIQETVKPSLFKEGFTTGKGTGYGLYLIKKMMEVYGWTIRETGTPSKGAQFTITIPRTNQNAKENYRIVARD